MTNLWTGLIDGLLLKASVRFAYLDETSSPDAAINVPSANVGSSQKEV